MILIGTIYSTKTGDSLPGATIQEIGGTAKAVTDSKGNFSMNVMSPLSYIKITHPDYIDKTVQATIFDISDFENLDPISGGTQLPDMYITDRKVNWFAIVSVTAIASAIVAAIVTSKKTEPKTVKAKI